MSRPQKPKNGREPSHNETTPLLSKPEDRPLPMGQMYLLCFARMVEPCKPERASPQQGSPESHLHFFLGLHRGILQHLPIHQPDGSRNRRS